MSYLGPAELAKILPQCIDKFDAKRIENVAYALGLGDEAYLTDSSSGKKEILDDKNTQVVIKPGQFALLVTEEVVEIPIDCLAFISIKFSQKIKGLINVSGFHVDPGFKGRIIFSVYNAGPAVIVLDKGKPYFMIWFSKLTDNAQQYNGKHNGQNGISAENIGSLKGELASPNVILEKLKSNENKLNNFLWAAGIIISMGVVITVKTWYDNSKYNEGYYAGLKEKKLKDQVDSMVTKINLDSIVKVKLDSTIKKRIENETEKK